MGTIQTRLQPGFDFLEQNGYSFELTLYENVGVERLDAFDDEFNLRLPGSFREIFLQSDGFFFAWENESIDHGSHLRDGNWIFPKLQELRIFRQRWVNGDRPAPEWYCDLPVDLDDQYFDSMDLWLPFEDHYNGDRTCVDCGTGKIGFACHDQFQAEPIVAENLSDYLANVIQKYFEEFA